MFDNSEHFTEHEESDGSGRVSGGESKNVFTRINESVVRPLFVRRFTYQVIQSVTGSQKNLTLQEKLENKQKFRNIAFEALRSAATNDSSSDELLFNSSTSIETAQPLLPK